MNSCSDEGKLFVGGIGWDTTEEKLKDHFSHYGDVAHVIVMRDRITGHPRGFGFVVFSDPTVVPSVLQNSHSIDGRTVEAKKAMSREQQQGLRTGATNSIGSSENIRTKKIFIGGLTSNLTEDELRQYFQDYGTITDVVIIYDQYTGQPRGFGFITFTTEEAVEKIIQKTFHELHGKRVEVKKALPKDATNRSYSPYNSSPRTYGNQMGGNNRFMQGYPPCSGYGASSYGYGVGNGNLGYSAYSGYGVGSYGGPDVGYNSPAGVYGTNFSKNQWRVPAGYVQNASFGNSVPWGNASRSSPAGRSPTGSSGYANQSYNYNNYGGNDASHASAGGYNGRTSGHNNGS